MKKHITTIEEYQQIFCETQGIRDIYQYTFPGQYFAKYDEHGSIYLILPLLRPIYAISQFVQLHVHPDQSIPTSDNDFYMWGFLRYSSGLLVHAYRGYWNVIEKWSDPVGLVERGIGCFLAVDYTEK